MRLRTLGGLRLEGSGLGRPKPLLLLAYLCLEGPRARSTLTGLFFPSSHDPADALSTTLRRLPRGGGLVFERDGKLATDLACDAVASPSAATSVRRCGPTAGPSPRGSP